MGAQLVVPFVSISSLWGIGGFERGRGRRGGDGKAGVC